MRDFVATNYKFFVKDYDSFDMDIKRTDFFRILILFHMGGVYIDIDFEALIPMDTSLLASDKFDIYLAEHVTSYERDGLKGEWPEVVCEAGVRDGFLEVCRISGGDAVGETSRVI